MDGWINIGTKIDTKSFEAQIEFIQQKMEEIEYQLSQADLGVDVGDTGKLEAEYEKLSNRLTELIAKQDKLNSPDNTGLIKSVEATNKSLTKTLSTIGKCGLAIFGLRSAYLGVRQAISVVTQYNEELAAKLESIKYTLAMAIEPIITKIVNIVYTLIQYVGYLAKAWFGVDIFANASAKAMASGAKSAKEMKKSLAGFDTAQVLSDNSSSGAGAGGGAGAVEPLPEGEIPAWLKWIADNGVLVASLIGGITGALIALKLEYTGIQALGIGLIIAGVILLIRDVIDWLKNPTWDEFADILLDISIILAGIGILIGEVPLLIAAAAVAIVAGIIKNWDKIKALFKSGWDYIKLTFKGIKDLAVACWDGIKTAFSAVGTFFKNVFTAGYNAITNVFSKIGNFFKGVWDGIKSIFSTIGTNIGNAFKSAFVSVINAVLKSAESVLNAPIKAVNKLLTEINKLPGVNMNKLSTFSLPRLATGGIVNNPGKGVPVGGAIAGEAGREGVLPLTDSGAMSLLGQEIGKWISVNVDLTTKLDSRVLSRSLEKVNQQNSFIRNGG